MTPSAPARTLSRLTGSVWIWPALVMLCVGGYRLTTPELWRDEVSTWTASTRGLGALLRMLENVDASNGVYYVLMHGWTTVFGDSPVALRLPSVLAMAGAAAFSSLTAQRMFDSRVAGLAAGLLFAVVPSISRYAQEARSYALVTCAVAAATWLLLLALERPGLARWAGYSACLALAGGAHLISLSTVGGQLALVLLHLWRTRAALDRRLLWHYPLAVGAALAPVAPLIALGSSQVDRQLGWIPTPTPYVLRTFGHQLFASVDVYHVFVVLALATLLWSGRRLPALQLLLLAEVPVVGVWIISLGDTSYFIDRYLLFTLPAWAALAGGGIGALYATARRWAPARLCAVLALAVIAVPAFQTLPQQRAIRGMFSHERYSDYRSAAAVIAAGYRPGDGVVAPHGDKNWAMIGPGLDFYLPQHVRPYPVFLQNTAAQAGDLYPVECPVAVQCVGQGGRIWVVTFEGAGADPLQSLPGDQANALLSQYRATEVRQVRGLTVSLLERRG
ncbi:glycosyltransferase family 39 protein [Kitasatospora sp. NPDC057015]|uniref:glycosyltransferase family 39 protein n=1 Tax=Kitasatospora sp. NPDC057015 TaxID=3346001 RepID=UPI003641EF5F